MLQGKLQGEQDMTTAAGECLDKMFWSPTNSLRCAGFQRGQYTVHCTVQAIS